MIAKATGTDVVIIQKPSAKRVGTWTIADIDQHFADFAPNDLATDAKAWILGLFEDQKNLLETGLSAPQSLQGFQAMCWYLVIQFLEQSQTGDSCPDGCKTPEQLEGQINYAKERVCYWLKKAGLTDPSICEYTNKSGLLQGMSSTMYSSCQ